MEEFVKRFTAAEPGFFAAEAAGLAWLAEADAVPVVTVRSQDENGLILEKLIEQRPVTKDRARQFGARLARLHDAGAEGCTQPRGGPGGRGRDRHGRLRGCCGPGSGTGVPSPR
jgi:fructosamine-3-kinase